MQHFLFCNPGLSAPDRNLPRWRTNDFIGRHDKNRYRPSSTCIIFLDGISLSERSLYATFDQLQYYELAIRRYTFLTSEMSWTVSLRTVSLQTVSETGYKKRGYYPFPFPPSGGLRLLSLV